MKKLMASHGETATEAQFREMYITIPGLLREQLKEEKITLVAAYREARAQMKKEADDPKSTDPSAKVLAPSMLCWLDLLIANETGQAAPRPGPSPRPGAPASSTTARGDSPAHIAASPAPDTAPAPYVDPYASHPVDCVRIDENHRGDYGAFKNVCDYPVSFVYCVQEPKSGWSKYFSCNPDSPRMGVDGIAARGIQAAFVKGETKVHWFACRKPKSPIARFDGRQIVGTCK